MKCEVCQKECYRYKVSYIDGKKYCKHDEDFIPTEPDMATPAMKADRRLYAKDTLQPFKKNGQPNEHFQKVYGKNNQAYI